MNGSRRAGPGGRVESEDSMVPTGLAFILHGVHLDTSDLNRSCRAIWLSSMHLRAQSSSRPSAKDPRDRVVLRTSIPVRPSQSETSRFSTQGSVHGDRRQCRGLRAKRGESARDDPRLSGATPPPLRAMRRGVRQTAHCSRSGHHRRGPRPPATRRCPPLPLRGAGTALGPGSGVVSRGRAQAGR